MLHSHTGINAINIFSFVQQIPKILLELYVAHDCFNWLSVLVLLPLEAASGLLMQVSQAMVNVLQLCGENKAPEVLKILIDPLTNTIIQVPNQVNSKKLLTAHRIIMITSAIGYFFPKS